MRAILFALNQLIQFLFTPVYMNLEVSTELGTLSYHPICVGSCKSLNLTFALTLQKKKDLYNFFTLYMYFFKEICISYAGVDSKKKLKIRY